MRGVGISIREGFGAAPVICIALSTVEGARIFFQGHRLHSLLIKIFGSFPLASNSHKPLSFNFKVAKARILLFQRHVGFEIELSISLH